MFKLNPIFENRFGKYAIRPVDWKLSRRLINSAAAENAGNFSHPSSLLPIHLSGGRRELKARFHFCSGGQYVSYGNESSSFAPRAVPTPKQKQSYFSVIIDSELFP